MHSWGNLHILWVKNLKNFSFGVLLVTPAIYAIHSLSSMSNTFINFPGIPLVDLKFSLSLETLKEGVRLHAVPLEEKILSTPILGIGPVSLSAVLVTKMS